MLSTGMSSHDPRLSWVCIEAYVLYLSFEAEFEKSAPAKRIMSLKEPKSKMSKSHADPRSRILINDSAEDIATKVRLAVTDSLPGVTYQPDLRPGVSNLLTIMSHLDDRGRSFDELADAHYDMSLREFKDAVSKTTDHALTSIRQRYNYLLKGSRGNYLDEVAKEGAVNARDMAGSILSTVRKVVGLS